MARSCAFCGKVGKQSVEDALPRWVGRAFPRTGRFVIREAEYGKGVTKQHPTPPLEVRVKQVCRRCNGSWMSALEDAAKPILLPMMKGSGVTLPLSPKRREVIATWALKTTMMFLYAWNTPRPPPLVERRWLFEKKRPPPNAQVWLALYSGPPTITAWSLAFKLEHDADPALRGDGELTTLCINQLVLQTLITRSKRGGSAVAAHTLDRPDVLDLWPLILPGTLTWPPLRAMDVPVLDNFWDRLRPRDP